MQSGEQASPNRRQQRRLRRTLRSTRMRDLSHWLEACCLSVYPQYEPWSVSRNRDANRLACRDARWVTVTSDHRFSSFVDRYFWPIGRSCAGDPTSEPSTRPGKWHATSWPWDTLCQCRFQIRTYRLGDRERVLNRHPEGGRAASGGSPCRMILLTFLSWPRDTCGTADSNADRVRVKWPGIELARHSELDHLPEVHHCDSITELVGYGEIVCNETRYPGRWPLESQATGSAPHPGPADPAMTQARQQSGASDPRSSDRANATR